jgi:glycine cleavage system T protein
MLKESPLAEWHRRNKAQFAPEDGWLLPLHFGDSLGEYRAVRTAVGLLDLCHRSLLRLTGPDRVSFLQGMVSNDVKGLAPGEGIYAAFLDIQGKILADARVLCAEGFFLVDLWESRREKILAHLSHYLVADDVEIADLTGEQGVLSLQGPKTSPLMTELLPGGQIPLGALSHRVSQVGGAEVRVIRSPHTGEEGYDLLVETKDLLPVASRIEELGKKFSIEWIGTKALEILRIESGIPRYGIDMDESTLLLETGLEQAVSFDKGCYLGQEVVERIRSRGHVNRRLVGMVLEGDTVAERGGTVRDGEKEIGKVTSSAFSPVRKAPLALGYVHRDYLQAGTPVTVGVRGKNIPAVISSLPFYRPSQPS